MPRATVSCPIVTTSAYLLLLPLAFLLKDLAVPLERFSLGLQLASKLQKLVSAITNMVRGRLEGARWRIAKRRGARRANHLHGHCKHRGGQEHKRKSKGDPQQVDAFCGRHD